MKVYIAYNMDTVYLEACYVTQRVVEGVFKSREDAEALIAAMDWSETKVEEWEVK